MYLGEARLSSWNVVDWGLALYTFGVACLVVFRASVVPEWPVIVAAHGALLAFMVWVPARGAPWERGVPGESPWRRRARRTARFLRYTYPALLLTPFFEEVRFTVNATSADHPYWFEPHLYAADRWLFGVTPAVAISQTPAPLLDEVMHALYFSYYLLIIGGIVIAWIGPDRARSSPGAGFHTVMTATMLSFFLAYMWYPFLPARGPWENGALMAGLREFDGFLITPMVRWMIERAAVSGACFPSAHIAGTWGMVIGLAAARHTRAAAWFGIVATGLSVACVYTRYHHAVDVLAGLVVAVAGGVLGSVLTLRPASSSSAPSRTAIR